MGPLPVARGLTARKKSQPSDYHCIRPGYRSEGSLLDAHYCTAGEQIPIYHISPYSTHAKLRQNAGGTHNRHPYK